MKIKAATVRHVLMELRALDPDPMRDIDVIAIGRVAQLLDSNLRDHEARKGDKNTCSCGDVRFAKYHNPKHCAR